MQLDEIKYKIQEKCLDIIDDIKWRFFMSDEEKKPYIEAKKINAENRAIIARALSRSIIAKQINPNNLDDLRNLQKMLAQDDASIELGRIIIKDMIEVQEKGVKHFKKNHYQELGKEILENMAFDDDEEEEDIEIVDDYEDEDIENVDDTEDF